MIGYGIYLLSEWNRFSPGGGDDPISPVSDGAEIWKPGCPMLLVTTLFNSFLDKLSTAWFIYVFIRIGAIIFLISFFGCIGAVTRNGCCLSFYAFLVILLILLELGAAAFIFFDHDWTDLIPHDKNKKLRHDLWFHKENWKIVKCFALRAVVLEALVFLLAILVRAANLPADADYDSDDEYIATRSIRQPLINSQQEKMGTGTADGSISNSFRGNDPATKNQTGHLSGPANTSGTANTAGPSPSSAPSTPSTQTPGDMMSMRSNKPLLMFGSRESQTRRVDPIH